MCIFNFKIEVVMKTKVLILLLVFLTATAAHALPALQLFIAGAEYDTRSQTWITTSNSFDLYVISANTIRNDVIVSMALGQTDNPADAGITFGGNVISNSDWVYGYAPMDNDVSNWSFDDIQRHNVFPTNFTEFNTGTYGVDQQVGSTLPNEFGGYWDPSQGGPIPGYVTVGEVKTFHVEIEGLRRLTSVHFDAYTLNTDGTINEMAPLFCDAGVLGMAPEPGTIALFGLGLLGVGGLSMRKRFFA